MGCLMAPLKGSERGRKGVVLFSFSASQLFSFSFVPYVPLRGQFPAFRIPHSAFRINVHQRLAFSLFRLSAFQHFSVSAFQSSPSPKKDPSQSVNIRPHSRPLPDSRLETRD